MLHSANRLIGFSIVATDGETGKLENIYFDDRDWTIRYFVVATGGWLNGRQVLISPLSVTAIAWDDKSVQLNLSQRQIEHSPEIDTDKPVSRRYETDFLDYFGYPHYWTGPFVWGATAFPGGARENAMRDTEIRRDIEQHHNTRTATNEQTSLRSFKEVAGYTIQTTDEAVGQAKDFLFNEEDWSIQLLVVDPHNWWPGKRVLISSTRVDHIGWAERKVVMTLSRAEVENSPEYDEENPAAPETRGGLYRAGPGPASIR
jgi:uncharacterized protein YrrD